jgi:hypothetical protein
LRYLDAPISMSGPAHLLSRRSRSDFRAGGDAKLLLFMFRLKTNASVALNADSMWRKQGAPKGNHGDCFGDWRFGDGAVAQGTQHYFPIPLLRDVRIRDLGGAHARSMPVQHGFK